VRAEKPVDALSLVESGTAPAMATEGSLSATTAIDTRELRTALAGFPTGVTVVTARSNEGRFAGVTVNSFCSVSLDPPLLLWCLSRTAPSRSVFSKASHFAIHVLAADQDRLSRRFSRAAPDKFAGLALGEGLGGAPLLDGVVALFECRRGDWHDAGDHFIILGTVERYRYSRRRPLVFHAGDLGGLGRER
jgi:flavin reductase (DIM6/NTAB) family NADH-FMN oxidoreductase RutF